jgi:hypothetical protein
MKKWISVEDELPEPGVTVLVTGDGFFNGYEASVQRWERVIDPNHKEDEPHWFGTREMEPYEDFKITHFCYMLEAPIKPKTIKVESK